MADVPNSLPEPPTDAEPYDNPLNPRGIPDYMTDGEPSAQATDAQKIQDATPARAPTLPTDISDEERVSAAQNRKPPMERIP